MEDDPFGSSVWAAETSTFSPKASASTFMPPAAEPPEDEGFDDFDDFGEAAEPTSVGTGDDDDFGDFGDFEDTVDDASGAPAFDNGGFGGDSNPIAVSTAPPVEMLRLRPMPDRAELRAQVERIIEPIFPKSEIAQYTTDEPIRQVGGLNQILVSEESRKLYATLTEPPTRTVPPTWTRSRTRRQHLISLGIPVNLDEMLPRPAASALPPLKITTRPMSAPPAPRDGGLGPAMTAVAAAASRGATPPRSGTPRSGTPVRGGEAAQLRLGPKPEIDEAKIAELLSLNPEALTLVPVAKLEINLASLKEETVKASALLTYLLQTRDALQQDSEMYNKLIGELVGQATQRAGPKGRTPVRKGSGFV